MTDAKIYRYRPSFLNQIFWVLAFSGCAVFMAFAAVLNKKGLIIDEVIRFDPVGGSIFFGVIALVAFVSAVYTFYGIYISLTSKSEIILTSMDVTVPQWMVRDQKSIIPLSSITNLSTYKKSRRRYLRIRHGGGETNIALALFRSKKIYNDFLQSLQFNIRASRAK